LFEGWWRSAAEAGAEAKDEVQTLATPIKDTAVCFMKYAERWTSDNLNLQSFGGSNDLHDYWLGRDINSWVVKSPHMISH
jgi:hypothetical protein